MQRAHDSGVDVPRDERTTRAGQAIRKARKSKGLSQEQLRSLLSQALQAHAAPGGEQTVGQPAVSRWEKGINAPERWKWRVIEDVLEMEPGTLAGIFLADAPAASQLDERLASIDSAVGELSKELARQRAEAEAGRQQMERLAELVSRLVLPPGT